MKEKMKKILGFMGIMLVGFIVIQILFLSGFKMDTIKSININFMTEIFSIIATVFILDKLMKRHEKKKQLSAYLNTLSTRHNLLINELSSTFTHFILKELNDKEDFETVLKTLDQKITSHFLKENYKITIINDDDLFNPKQENVSYQVFCKFYFKDKIESLITKYLNRYISFVPNEVLVSLFRIDDLLKSNILVTPNDIGLNLDISEAKFKPSEMVDVLNKIGNEILKLKNIS